MIEHLEVNDGTHRVKTMIKQCWEQKIRNRVCVLCGIALQAAIGFFALVL